VYPQKYNLLPFHCNAKRYSKSRISGQFCHPRSEKFVILFRGFCSEDFALRFLHFVSRTSVLALRFLHFVSRTLFLALWFLHFGSCTLVLALWFLHFVSRSSVLALWFSFLDSWTCCRVVRLHGNLELW